MGIEVKIEAMLDSQTAKIVIHENVKIVEEKADNPWELELAKAMIDMTLEILKKAEQLTFKDERPERPIIEPPLENYFENLITYHKIPQTQYIGFFVYPDVKMKCVKEVIVVK